jgi:hypothetical protein
MLDTIFLDCNLKRVVLFENFSPQYAHAMRCKPVRAPTIYMNKVLAVASLRLEVLSASFLAEANLFFQACQSSWTWPDLVSLSLTSRLLKPDIDQEKIYGMLQAAANAAMRMPKLQTMEIWFGKMGLAAMFRYQSIPARITWRGTWDLSLSSDVTLAWENVAVQQHRNRLEVVKSKVDTSLIESHGDAIHYLEHSGTVVRPVSLRQIRRENRAHHSSS